MRGACFAFAGLTDADAFGGRGEGLGTGVGRGVGDGGISL